MTHFRVPKWRPGKPGKTNQWTQMASRAKLLSYIGFMAGDCGAYVGHVAPQCVAMAAIWLPKTHHLVPKWVRFGVLTLLCWPYRNEACIWEGQNSDFEESCIVLTHFRVPNGSRFKGGETTLLLPRASRAKAI